MSNKRITDLTELTNPTTDDVFPVVDIASNTTTKVQLGNLPVPTSVTTALATKENTITPGTTAQYFRGDKSFQTLDKTAVGLANVDNTSDANKPVSTAQQTALNAKQETLVSGTNIKTLNSTSLLGSGNIVLTANPSGVAGAIQFSNGSAFASDASNLFWDDTNNRFGVGTNAPLYGTQLQSDTSGPNTLIWSRASGSLNTSGIIFSVADNTVSGNQYHKGGIFFKGDGVGAGRGSLILVSNTANDASVASSSNVGIALLSSGNNSIGTLLDLGARLGIKGSGSTSATTSLLVQNSAGDNIFRVRDDKSVTISASSYGFSAESFLTIQASANTLSIQTSNARYFGSSFNFGTATPNASAHVQMDSTTKGFLPPRMTTTERNAISSPAAGLVVYDSTTNKLCCYNGSTWNDLF